MSNNKASELTGFAGVERLVCQGLSGSFPTASFVRHRGARSIPAICLVHYILVTFNDACPTSSALIVQEETV